MTPLDFTTLAQQCAPQVSLSTMEAIVRTESGFNPFAIGVVHGRLLRQPVSEAEAVATVKALAAGGWNFSVGLAQVNRANWDAFGLNERNAFDPCRNLAAGGAILQGCFERAQHAPANVQSNSQSTLRASLSCYSTGNFSTGYRTGYVQRVVDNVRAPVAPRAPAVVPAIAPIPVVPVDSGIRHRSMGSGSSSELGYESTHTSPAAPGGEPDLSAVVF
jgi:type IV secretion system protein VirB1